MTVGKERFPPIEDDETRAFVDELHEHYHQGRGFGPELSAGDPDARWDLAESSGEETAAGSMSTPDQNDVDAIGEALGIVYGAGEALKLFWKEEARDRHRWELDPASADDYREREAQPGGTGPSDPLLSMRNGGGRRPHKR
jgi:hypothetical protein